LVTLFKLSILHYDYYFFAYFIYVDSFWCGGFTYRGYSLCVDYLQVQSLMCAESRA